MNYLYVPARISAEDPGLFGLGERYEDEGRQGCLGVVATETALEIQTQKNKFLYLVDLKRKKIINHWMQRTS